MSTANDHDNLLRIYLEDHVAGSAAGTQRATRLAEAESETPDAAAFATLAADIEADRDALLALMDAAGVEPSRLKAGIASVGEKLAALKPNGRGTDRSPLSSIVDIEAMQMAVRGKRSLWETLRVAMPTTTAVDIDGLISRADDQLRVLSDLHGTRAMAAFAEPRI